jgi:glycosyltransferase involved in cell wall biosynthesis
MTTSIGWQIQQIDLRYGIPDIAVVTQHRGVYAVLWWGDVPLGHCKISAPELPLSSAQLLHRVAGAIAPAVAAYNLPESFRAPLPHAVPNLQFTPALEAIMKIDQPLEGLPHSPCFSGSISVVICTRDRPDQLENCLRSLQTSSHPPQEIIVVDNAPHTDMTCQRVAQIPGVKYVLEPRPGLDIARNTGIHHSTGDIIAFTDDDVQIHPNWLVGVQRAFTNPQVQAMTGLVLPIEIATEAQDMFEQYWSFNRGYCRLEFDTQYFQQLKPWGVPAWCVGAGANMAFRRSLFEQVGEFDERLDVGAAGCSGDSEMWYRIMAAGGTCLYEPTAVVFHQHRRELESLKRQIFSYMRGHVAALLIQFEKTGHWGNLRRLFLSLPQHYIKLLGQRFLQGYKLRHFTLFREIKGCFSGVWFYSLDRLKSVFIRSSSLKSNLP